jgi:hypothetical protein
MVPEDFTRRALCSQRLEETHARFYRRCSLDQFQSTHIMNQSANPTGISASISASTTSFMATDLHSAFRMPGALKNGSRASESSMNPVDA